MEEKVFFKNLSKKIISEIKKADSEILVAVAWFTDKEIIRHLERKVNEGVNVTIVIYENKNNDPLSFKNLYLSKAKVFLSKKLMHNKFCVIDRKIVLNGSYNWTFSANKNHENIQVSNSSYLIKSFVKEFNEIIKKCNSIEDYLNISIDSLKTKIDDFKELYIANLKLGKYPYFLLSKPFLEYYSEYLNEGYYLIRNESEEYYLNLRKYCEENNLKYSDIFTLIKPIEQEVLFFDDIPSLNKGKVHYTNSKHSYLVEKTTITREHLPDNIKYDKHVFFINNYGKIISSKIRYIRKLSNGNYFTKLYSQAFIYTKTLDKINLSIEKSEFIKDFGILGQRILKPFGICKFGVLDYNGNVIVPFIFDRKEDFKNKIIFYENSIINIYPYKGFEINIKQKSNQFKKRDFSLSNREFEENKEIIGFNLENTFISNYRETPIFYSELSKLEIKFFEEYYKYKKLNNFNYFNIDNLRIDDMGVMLEKYKKFSYLSGSDIFFTYDYYLEKFTSKKELSKKKEGCYIATHIYGSYSNKNVVILRHFRDDYLKSYALGNLFISNYYHYSPILIKKFNQNLIFNLLCKIFLDIIIKCLPKKYK